MMLHRMSPLMASDDSDGDVALTPPPPSLGKTTEQRSSPKTLSLNELGQDADYASDGKDSPTEQKDGQSRTYSYMSPISSDVDDVAEKPEGTDRTKPVQSRSTKSSHQEKPRRRGSVRKTLRRSNIATVKSESEMEDYVSEASQRVRRQAQMPRKGSDQESRNGVTKKAPTSRTSDGGASEDEAAKDSAERQAKNSSSERTSFDEDVKEKPKKPRGKVTPKRKAQALINLLGESDQLEQPTGESRKPRVKEKEGTSPRKAVPIECKICGRSIRCKAILERHMLSHTGEKPFGCDECGKHYTSSSNLRIHQLSHSGKMDYVCNECGQKFTHLPYLKRHLLRHAGKKMHICEHCGKGFIQKYHLLRHLLVHTKQTPHICDRCGMSFNRTDNLRLHLHSVHQIERDLPEAKPEKLYTCETCTKSFVSQASLEIHKRIHTGAMPYSCTVCSRQFKQSSHLYSHMFTHAREKPHACNLCELKFTRRTYLRKHKERVHVGAGEQQSS
ncbi:hypothetical protein AMELA_G00097290 [Ameiurus melas]|uniref:C2H2-type domain-containing protein n=1 Tax=Ameiurus melas TaxID=219545 RepID=A0A7J6ASL8_AMEME|nr:hypothetical protein AMELA_G00097290 [Ameiurus melas]